MNRVVFFIFIFLFATCKLHAQQSKSIAIATKTLSAPHIDGNPDEDSWQNAIPIDNFQQYDPFHGKNSRFKTEIRIIYDNEAIYFSGKLYDSAPDSILRQLGNRDDNNINADYFSIEIDTYNSKQDAFSFTIYSSGVQADSRINDRSFDAVWQSHCLIHDWGWSFEIKIPYSAIRFPKKEEQIWGLQLTRYIRRNRQFDQWALCDNDISNPLMQWGELQGIENVEPGIRLSFTPYLNSGIEHYPYTDDKATNYSYLYGGGMDVKYGISESFTLDMTLLPDFSQVQSDDKIKNLSAFETTYSEQREFFNEAVDLFNKGGLFYSRRIGKTPEKYTAVENELEEGESLTHNPASAQLLNATKISGRTKKGTAFGFLNAYTQKTYASIVDSTGRERKVLTEPNANYNIFVIDQNLKNNSSFYFINTNVSRGGEGANANVSGTGFSLSEKSTTYYLSANAAVSQQFQDYKTAFDSINPGFKYNYSFSKQSGNFRFSISQSIMDEHFDANDFGITQTNDFQNNNASLSYNIYNPFWKLKELYNTLSLHYNKSRSTNQCIGNGINFSSRTTTMQFLFLRLNLFKSFDTYYDYYEPRKSGYFYIRPKQSSVDFMFSSDYRRAFALDGGFEYAASTNKASQYYSFNLSPIVRVNNHLGFEYNFSLSKNISQKGYTTIDSLGNVIFASRDVTSIQQVFDASYIFVNNLSLKLRLRHYWSKGFNKQFYILNEEGKIIPNPSFDASDHNNYNFNFNAFTLDLGLYWEFAPGSNLSLVWKNEILTEDAVIIHNYFDNISQSFQSPQQNILTLKVFYYLDYATLKKALRSKKEN
jgi:hypothetical protein